MLRLLFFVLLISLAGVSSAQTRVMFNRSFAPTESFVSAPEKPFRTSLCLNGTWQFQPVPVPANFARGLGTPPDLPLPNAQKWERVPIKIPSPWNVNTWGNGRDVGVGTNRPFVSDSIYYPSYPASWDAAEMGWLRRSFSVPPGWTNRRLVLRFEAVAGSAQVWVNGQKIGEHLDSFLPFEFDISRAIKRGQPNEILVGVRKSDLFDRVSPDYPIGQKRTYPNGSNMDHLVGIWNDVWLLGLPPARTDDVFVQSDLARDTLRAQITLRNDSNSALRVRVGGEVKPWINDTGTDVLSAPEPKWHLGQTALLFATQVVTLGAGKTLTVQLQTRVNGKLRPWSPQTPHLNGVVVLLSDEKGAVLDRKFARFGWRQFVIVGRELRLNGRKIQLFGDLLHPFGPFIGSRRMAWAWLRTVKDVGGNMIRPHAQPHPRALLDLADELGVCVLDEAAVFGSSINLNLKEPQTWTRLQNHVDDLVLRDRNHPSVFGWSVGNEMFALLSRANPNERARETKLLVDLARRPLRLDPTREWVSVDGDEDLGGALQVWNRHFGIGVPAVPDVNKPRMIGEHGGTYYALPDLLQPLGGERVWQGVKERNEALGVDLYRAITQRAKPDLAVFSPSELAWFGLEHLPFGFAARDRVPSQLDGVWFPKFVENQPGVQIERLPPYAMTLNPGFDSSLPLRRELPMFEAMRDALSGKNAAHWAVAKPVAPRTHPVATNALTQVAFEGNRAGAFLSLLELGVPLVEAGDDAQLLVIDGETLAAPDAPKAVRRAQNVLRRGGLVWLMMGEHDTALPLLRPLLGAEFRLAPRRATSLLHGETDARLSGFSPGDLFFRDGAPMQFALAGTLAPNWKALLRASNTDWTLFDRQPESAKQSSLILFERLSKGADAALIQSDVGGGQVWVSTLDTRTTDATRAFWTQLWRNLGVKVTPPRDWLAAPGRDQDTPWKFSLQMPDANWMATDFDDSAWQTGEAPFGTDVPNGKLKTLWNSTDIWARRAFDLKEIPRALRLLVHHDEDVEVFLNGEKVWSETAHLSDYKEIELPVQALSLLRVGRNVLAVRCHQTAGGQFLDVGLSAFGSASALNRSEHNLLLDGPEK